MIVSLLLSMPTAVLGVLFVSFVVLIAIAGLLVVRRMVPLHILEAHNEVAGFVISVIGVVYAVLLALVVIAVWEQFEDAEVHVEQEANVLGDLYRDAFAFPVQVQDRLHEQLHAYARIVVDEEWPAMAQGKASQRAWDVLNNLWGVYIGGIEPVTAREHAFYSESIKRLNDLVDARRLRLLASRNSLPGILWAMLVFGGITTVGFTYFFGLKNTRAQVLMTAILAATVAFVIFVVMAMDHPFTGDVSVSSEAFEQVLKRIEMLTQR